MVKVKKIIEICPNCGSKKTNKVTDDNYFCMDCDVEYNFYSGKVYSILYDGDLVDYFFNEFADCG